MGYFYRIDNMRPDWFLSVDFVPVNLALLKCRQPFEAGGSCYLQCYVKVRSDFIRRMSIRTNCKNLAAELTIPAHYFERWTGL